ncbi:hypothetical protein ACPVTF_10515 [Geobacillus icigianus]|uniref:Uncharacterized protein n=1 Tax=Geobacillus subterraneus TaxID=129338 RepID=A0A679FM23_9BACL|nr:hypothetical protein [Geobacillus subterraneus]BBW95989.1 hypothetical protein GsuE55_08220 [Geobacillus subterraneus]
MATVHDMSLPQKGDDWVKNGRHETEDMTQLLQIINAKGKDDDMSDLGML